MSFKPSLLVRFEILGLCVYTLTTNDQYSRHNRDNFKPPIQMAISKKPNTICQVFIAFLKSR